eukprot:gene13012-17444_t
MLGKEASISFETLNLQTMGAIKYQLKCFDQYCTVEKALTLLASGDEDLINALNSIIYQFSSEAIFWECRPVTFNTIKYENFEFVILPSTSLALRRVDISYFQQYFTTSEPDSIITFTNLGGDAQLIVPCPHPSSKSNPPQYMTHLQSFIRESSPRQKRNLWMMIGSTVIQKLIQLHENEKSDQKLFISTSGLGVSWLHVRLDSIPKYYNWMEYKTML